MKKVSIVLSALLIASMAFIGCSNGSDSEPATDPEPTVSTIWEGNIAIDTSWSTSGSIEAAKFADCDEKGTFTFTITVGTEGYHQIKLASNEDGWPYLEDVAAANDANTYHCIMVDGDFTFSLSAAEIAKVKANGLIVQGYDFTTTKLTYTPGEDE